MCRFGEYDVGSQFFVFTVFYCIIFHAFAELYSERRQLLVIVDKFESAVCFKENLHLYADLVPSRHQGLVHQEVVDFPFLQTH